MVNESEPVINLAWNCIDNFDGIRGLKNLRVLNLAVNQLNDVDLKIIRSLPNLETIMLHSNPLESTGIHETFLKLTKLPSLKRFSCNKQISDKIRSSVGKQGWKLSSVPYYTQVDDDSVSFFKKTQ
ncbi:MAG: leucine-rich repeat domain-containing protein [Promethearchaeota archaeon]